MPLLNISEVARHARLGLWRMDECAEQLYGQLPGYCREEAERRFRNEGRRREFLSVRMLLRVMTGDDTLRIGYEDSGKPVLPGWSVSISHTRGYAALLLARSGRVAVDIEQRSDRVERIAHMFIGDGEPARTTDEKLLLWSAKETVYKLYSEDRLGYFDMQMEGLSPRQIQIVNKKRHEPASVNYFFSDDYVLTWAVVPASRQEETLFVK